MKKLSAFLLILALLVSLLPLAVSADGCDGGCTPDFDSPHEADPVCEYGIHQEHYWCLECYGYCYADGSPATYEDAIQDHTFGEMKLAADEIHDCDGWYTEDYYPCLTCHDGFVPSTYGDETYWYHADREWGFDYDDVLHYPILDNPHEPDGTACGGGIMEEYYSCSLCYEYCYADGSLAVEVDVSPTGHTPGYEEKADFVECEGGYREDGYRCSVCYERCDADGDLLTWYEGSDHVLDGIIHPASEAIHYCDGWYIEDYQLCIYCNRGFVDNDGYFWHADMEYPSYDAEGLVHRVSDGEMEKANYTPCNGGFQEDSYRCDGCYERVNADGEVVEYQEAEEGAKHTPFLGFYVEVPDFCLYIISSDSNQIYRCIDCLMGCDINGNTPDIIGLEEPLAHQWVLCKAEDETANKCTGWYSEDYYKCSRCSATTGVGSDGKPDEDVYPDRNWDDDNLVHNMTHYPAKKGFHEFFVCTDCYSVFTDDQGQTEVLNLRDLLTGEDPDNSLNAEDDGEDNEDEECSDCDSNDDGDGSYLIIIIVAVAVVCTGGILAAILLLRKKRAKADTVIPEEQVTYIPENEPTVPQDEQVSSDE